MSKRVLIITYYWPPTAGSGVQRWLKMSKYLPQYGWQPVIYTPSNPEAGMTDESLLKDICPEAEIAAHHGTIRNIQCADRQPGGEEKRAEGR